MKSHIEILLVVSLAVVFAGCSRNGRGSNDATGQDNVPLATGEVKKSPASAKAAVAQPEEHQAALKASGPSDQMAAARQDVANVAGSMSSFYADCGRYPTTAEGVGALQTRPAQITNWQGPYTTPYSPKDPWGNAYVYQCPGTHNKDGFDFYSKGPDGQAGTADDIGNWEPPAAPNEQTPPPVSERER